MSASLHLANIVTSLVAAGTEKAAGGGFLGILTNMVADLGDLAQSAIKVGIIVIAAYVAFSSRMAIGKVVGILVVGGVIWWWVTGGLSDTSKNIGEDLQSKAAAPIVRLVDQGRAPGLGPAGPQPWRAVA